MKTGTQKRSDGKEKNQLACAEHTLTPAIATSPFQFALFWLSQVLFGNRCPYSVSLSTVTLHKPNEILTLSLKICNIM